MKWVVIAGLLLFGIVWAVLSWKGDRDENRAKRISGICGIIFSILTVVVGIPVVISLDKPSVPTQESSNHGSDKQDSHSEDGTLDVYMENKTTTIQPTSEYYLGKDLQAYANGLYYKEFSADTGKSFSMGGVSYYNGFTIGTYTNGGYACFNLNGQYRSLTGVAGNVDGVNHAVTYNVLGDGELLTKINIAGGGLPVPFDIDVTGVKELKIQATGDSNYSEGVGFGNPVVSVLSSVTPKVERPKSQESAKIGQDVRAYVNGLYYKEFSADNGKTFSMGGVSYNSGFTIGTYTNGGYACFNLDGQYQSLTGVAGNVDGVNHAVTYNVLGDGELLKKIDIPGGGLPVPFDIDVTGVKELKIQATGDSNYSEGVGFGNAVLSVSSSIEPKLERPQSKDGAKIGQDIHAYVNGLYYKEFSIETGKGFSMGGVTYDYGFTIGTYTNGGYACFNLDGQYKSLTGVAGNVDGVNHSVSYNVLGDGKLLKKIAVPSGGLPVSFNIDVTGVRELKFQATGDSNYSNGVGFGNLLLGK